MEDGVDDLVLHMRWRNRPLTGEAYIGWVRGLMAKLAEVHPKLSNLYILHDSIKKSVLVGPDSPNIDAAIVATLDHSLRYISPAGTDTGGELYDFTLAATSSLGFQTGLSTSIKSGSSMGVGINIGRRPFPDEKGSINDFVHVDINANSEFCQVAKALFSAIVEYARPEHGSVWRFSVRAYPKQPVEVLRVGWLTYFSDPAVGARVPTGIHVEPLAGGVLIQASEQPPMPNDTQDVAAIGSIFTALEGAGLLSR